MVLPKLGNIVRIEPAENEYLFNINIIFSIMVIIVTVNR